MISHSKGPQGLRPQGRLCSDINDPGSLSFLSVGSSSSGGLLPGCEMLLWPRVFVRQHLQWERRQREKILQIDLCLSAKNP